MREQKEVSMESIQLLHELESAICKKIDQSDSPDRLLSAWCILTPLLFEYRSFRSLGINASSARGLLAEIMVKYLLEHWAKTKKQEYIYKSNLLLPRPDGGTTQLDSVFITPSIAIVVECKSYYGKLKIANGSIGTKTGVSYPWRQNYGHIMSLKEVLRQEGITSNIYYHNLVYIFSEGLIANYTPVPEEFLMVNRVAMDTLDKMFKNCNFKNSLDVLTMKTIEDVLNQYVPTVEDECKHIDFVTHLVNKTGGDSNYE